MPGLVSTVHLSSGQDCQVSSSWSEQDRSRGSGNVRIVLVSSGQSSLVGWLCQVRSGLLGQVSSGYVSSNQVSSG